ncbi:MAG: hypothetical protein AB1425_04440 [Actinomycetota bacterium]
MPLVEGMAELGQDEAGDEFRPSRETGVEDGLGLFGEVFLQVSSDVSASVPVFPDQFGEVREAAALAPEARPDLARPGTGVAALLAPGAVLVAVARVFSLCGNLHLRLSSSPLLTSARRTSPP